MQKVLVSASHFDTLCKDAWNLFEQNGIGVIFDPNKPFPSYSTEEIENHPEKNNIVAALIGMDDFRDEKKYKALPNLKAVAKFGVGVDNIDGELAKRYGVKALNAPGQNSNAVAELTIAFMLDLLRRVTPLHEAMENGEWPRSIGNEIKGKTVGLLGFGAIARLVAQKLQSFDVKVLAFDLYPDEKVAKELGVKMTTREVVLTNSDIVSIHIPATPETYHFFDDETFAMMKKGAFLINPARGALVDLDALARALMNGQIAGAALDAFELEPLPRDASILQCENIVLTPHTGAETEESYYNVSMTTAQDIIRVVRGEQPEHCVNY
ncbi:MAG: phosphoglycerate dehydrogenase [Lachnospiraceae bacterium]|uniref:phosphoglycerate dehydrogenase n=1 Tax=Parablautia sp. Marseille-Q6255 TaxID=3039593 RepID=UPI0024BC5654|nr:phosphoglycerate dehydrogenase [Parablautia sp. Marseille-Q6255]